MELHEQIRAIETIFDAKILYSPHFPPGELERMEAMAARKQPQRQIPQTVADKLDDPAAFSDAEFEDDGEDIPEFQPPKEVQEELKALEKQKAAAAIATLEPRDMWRVSFPAHTASFERHFLARNGRYEKETHTIRAGSWDEYMYLKSIFDQECEDRWASEPPPQQPQRQERRADGPPSQRQQRSDQEGGNAEYCEVHNVWMKRYERNGQVWHSHYMGEDREGNRQFCRGGR